MVYYIRKRIKGHTYIYLYECKRDKITGKPKNRMIKYIKRDENFIVPLPKIKLNKCKKCGSQKNLVIDHIIPMTKGGTNEIYNLQVLCKKCNEIKGDKIENYGDYLEFEGDYGSDGYNRLCEPFKHKIVSCQVKVT